MRVPRKGGDGNYVKTKNIPGGEEGSYYSSQRSRAGRERGPIALAGEKKEVRESKREKVQENTPRKGPNRKGGFPLISGESALRLRKKKGAPVKNEKKGLFWFFTIQSREEKSRAPPVMAEREGGGLENARGVCTRRKEKSGSSLWSKEVDGEGGGCAVAFEEERRRKVISSTEELRDSHLLKGDCDSGGSPKNESLQGLSQRSQRKKKGSHHLTLFGGEMYGEKRKLGRRGGAIHSSRRKKQADERKGRRFHLLGKKESKEPKK